MAVPTIMNALLITARIAAAAAIAATAEPVVHVLNGSYEGLHLPSFQQDVFLGIPYAQDTGGANRFRPPRSLDESWSGLRPAKTYGHACPDHLVDVDGRFSMSEDCLSVNVVRPASFSDDDEDGDGNGTTRAKKQKLPVMLWIHGGSYQVGTSALPNYNLTFLVRRSVEVGLPVLAASINYRKGGWGNMYSREIQVLFIPTLLPLVSPLKSD